MKYAKWGSRSVIIFMLVLLSLSNVDAVPELIPREVLFGNPVKTRARLSPDGKLLAYLAPVDSVLNVWIRTIGVEDDRSITKDETRGIRYYSWAED
ncbi:hypothetical protein AMJ74_02550, partial [candidate division WOR_3 bacterium SM1_77]